MGLLLLQMGLLLLGLRRAQACSEAAPATARTREVYVVTRSVLCFCRVSEAAHVVHVHCTCARALQGALNRRPLECPPRHAAQRTRGGASCATVARPHVDVSSRDLFI